MSAATQMGWDRLRHGGLLLDAQRLESISRIAVPLLSSQHTEEFRRQSAIFLAGESKSSTYVSFVLERVCGFQPSVGIWQRGSAIGVEWARRTLSGETCKPQHVWRGQNGAVLPVFIDNERQIGFGRGRRIASHVVQWLRAGSERLALLTNGRQWRLIFAGLDFDAFCEWESDIWFQEGELSSQVIALRTLLSPTALTPTSKGQQSPLLSAILDSRKGQAELSSALGERVREAVELLVQVHGEALKHHCNTAEAADIYRVAVRVVMRIVVVLFAESRDLLPRDNALYHGAYGVGGLLEELEKISVRGGNRLARSYSAWPRLLALFRLVHEGSHHPALSVPAYGGELFAPASSQVSDGLSRALTVFETAAFDSNHAMVSDRDVYRLLEKISRTRVRLRQGRRNSWVTVPVDFTDLSSEYIGILYEGLLDFELRTAQQGDPVVFLAVGNQPALPLSRLETMEDKALADLLEKMKDASKKGDDDAEDSGEAGEDEDTDTADVGDDAPDFDDSIETDTTELTGQISGDHRHATRSRAEIWARRAVEAGKLVARPRGPLTPDKHRIFEDAIVRKARQLVVRIVLPGEWFLVRWGGTRKGSGTFYTRPGLAVPTVQRTLRPLAYIPPNKADGTPNTDAPASEWMPRCPEDILKLKICDPACGSGTFPVASLRYLTDALYAAVHQHGRVSDRGDRSVISLLHTLPADASDVAALGQELVPCRADDPTFELRLKAVLKRHVVERCIYGVDLDPLAVELCRLSLWIETMDRTLPFSFLDHKVKCGNGLLGTWFDQFLHYPVMAWKNRDGGDKGHSNGVHFTKDAHGKVLREFSVGRLRNDLAAYLSGPTLFDPRDRSLEAGRVHTDALNLLGRLHDLPMQDAAERARIYRQELLLLPAWQGLKAAMDLWCACWFWPAMELDHAPLPTTFAEPSQATQATAVRLAARLRFFHWELEFPDVFRSSGAGFDAILGNPPWETLQPNSKEFFSNLDPLFRTYGKQEALRYQTGYFNSKQIESDWLDYNASFAAYSNWMKYAGSAYGDPNRAEGNDRFSIARGAQNDVLHMRWRDLRSRTIGYADPTHPFRHRGEGKAYTYKLFLEYAHALLRDGGRLGFIVPSGLYSDHGTGDLRRLFLDCCQWEWLFGFENRDGVFQIDSRFKFNPVIITKGGSTAEIRTAFMRRKLEDWERAEEFATPYTRAQVDQFSPRSQAILEIQSARDLEILEKIYAKSVLLGSDAPSDWGIQYAQGDFNMTSDSKLFPQRTKWEDQGYRPDEYSRWLKGDWRPIDELWVELGVDPTRVTAPGVLLKDWLFDRSVSPYPRDSEEQLTHGKYLKPGDVARTAGLQRCAQPPYDKLPIPRSDIPAGIVLSREADAWISTDSVEDVALPVYQGKMIWQFDPAFAGFGVHSGNNWSDLPWDGKILQPRYLMSTSVERTGPVFGRILIRDISSPTNQRTLIAAFVPSWPSGHKTPILSLTNASLDDNLLLLTQLNSLTLDYFLRLRFAISGGGGSLIYATLSELALWKRESLPVEAHQWMAQAALRLTGMQTVLSYAYEQLLVAGQAPLPVAVTPHERLRLRCILDALNAAATGLTADEFRWILRDCDHPVEKSTNRIFTRELFGKGFWRIDKEQHPELRHTVLTLIAFDDLEVKIREHGGNRYAGIAEFIDQNDGEGWLLPETLRLADFGLGHDDRAKHVQTVASTLGPRFYDWQLLSGPFEVLNDFRLHTRHIVDHQGLRRPEIVSAAIKSHKSQNSLAQGQLFDPTKVDATEKVQLP